MEVLNATVITYLEMPTKCGWYSKPFHIVRVNNVRKHVLLLKMSCLIYEITLISLWPNSDQRFVVVIGWGQGQFWENFLFLKREPWKKVSLFSAFRPYGRWEHTARSFNSLLWPWRELTYPLSMAKLKDVSTLDLGLFLLTTDITISLPPCGF